MPQLKNIIGETFQPKNDDERRFFNKHISVLFNNLYSSSEYDDLFKGTNVRVVDRPGTRHGYTVGDDEKVYESVEEMYDNEPTMEHDDYNAAHTGAQRYLDNLDSNHEHHGVPVGHIMSGVCHAAKNCGVPKSLISNAVGANSWSFKGENHGPLEGMENDIRGGNPKTNKFSGMTMIGAHKKAVRKFKEGVKKAIADGKPVDVANYESLEVRAMQNDEMLQELTESLHGRPVSIYHAMKATAEQHALPLPMVAVKLAHEHIQGQGQVGGEGGIPKIGSMTDHFMRHYHTVEKDRKAAQDAKYKKGIYEAADTDDTIISLAHMTPAKKKQIAAAIADLAADVTKEAYNKDAVDKAAGGRASKVTHSLLKGWRGDKSKPAAKSSVKSMNKAPIPEDVKKKSDDELDETQTIVKRVRQTDTSKLGDVLQKIKAGAEKHAIHHKHREDDKKYMKPKGRK